MFSKQNSAPLGSRLDLEKEAKVFIHGSSSSSSLQASSLAAALAVAAAASPQLNNHRRRARSLLALALTLLAVVAVAAWGAPSPDKAGVLSPRLSSSSPSSSSSSSSSSLAPPHPPPPPPAPRRFRLRRPLPSPEASVVAAALASRHDTEESKSDAAFPLAVMRAPLLTPAELLTLQHYARGSVYAEWGSGASTVLAAPLARRAVSIENQKSWCDEMLASADVDFWVKNKVLTYLCVDTGATGRFGTPMAESDPKLFVKYLDALDDAAAAVKTMTSATTKAAKTESFPSSARLSLSGGFPAAKGGTEKKKEHQKQHNNKSNSTTSTSSSSTFTVVLVDGRFRVACALKALWHLDHLRGVLLVHDWVARGEQYHTPILKRYSLLSVVDRLGVLAPSFPPETDGDGDGKDDEEEKENSRLRWWAEAAAEMEKFSRDAA